MKIFCIGRNYAEHAREMQHEIPKEPVIFMKPKNALLLNNAPFYYPDFTVDLQYECELVLRVCKNGRKVKEKFARKYYDQLTLGIDFTARDLQAKQKENGLPWEIAKSFDHSAPLGKLIDLSPEADLSGLSFTLWKNDEKVQEGNTRDLLFSFDRLICNISQYFSLNIGDYIYTGTPAGVGRVQIGDHLKACLGDECLLEFDIR